MNVSDLFDTLDWRDGTYSGDLYYGYDTTTELTVSGGSFGPGHLQVGRDNDATMTQTGGEVVAGGVPDPWRDRFPRLRDIQHERRISGNTKYRCL